MQLSMPILAIWSLWGWSEGEHQFPIHGHMYLGAEEPGDDPDLHLMTFRLTYDEPGAGLLSSRPCHSDLVLALAVHGHIDPTARLAIVQLELVPLPLPYGQPSLLHRVTMSFERPSNFGFVERPLMGKLNLTALLLSAEGYI